MTIQILRKGNRYCIRVKRRLFWRYVITVWRACGRPLRDRVIGEDRLLAKWERQWFDSYAIAKRVADRIERAYVVKLTEKISPYVVEDEIKV